MPAPALSKHYDYIICGGGMAGLSLAWHINRSGLRNKSVLIIEPSSKNTNDRTWAFWEDTAGPFEDILCKVWENVLFVTETGTRKKLETAPYRYKLLRGIDFYTHVLHDIRSNPGMVWLKDTVSGIKDAEDHATVETTSHGSFTARYAFDSTHRLSFDDPSGHHLLQHFKGFVIETDFPFFDEELPEMMNFSVPQVDHECRFIYVLPFTRHQALIEYTVFSENLLDRQEYDRQLENYIKNSLGIGQYSIVEEEFGIIPMSDTKIEEFPGSSIVRIGTSGGYTNPSTGYTFRYTQKRLKEMVAALEKTGSPELHTGWFDKRFRLYASIFLNVLKNKRHGAGDIFDRLYTRNHPSFIFRFLDGETRFLRELKIMSTTPVRKFMAAALDVFRLKLFR